MIFNARNIIGWDGSIGDYVVVEIALTEEYLNEKVIKGSYLYAEGNWFKITLDEILNDVWNKRNIDLLVQKHIELRKVIFTIYNDLTVDEDYYKKYQIN